jgi:glutathione S-transferase
MTLEYLSVEEAIRQRGLRLVVVGGMPSPWTEAAKGMFHVKRIPFVAVRLVYDDERLRRWTGESSAPVAMVDDEPPRSGWAEILMLAERLAAAPVLLPQEPLARSRALSLAEKFCGPGGLGWSRRLQCVHAGLTGVGGFTPRIATYLGRKYGYDPARAAEHGPQIRALLGDFAAVLREQRAAGGSYYLGDTMSAVDIYSAAFMALFAPLPEDQCRMDPGLRAALEYTDADTGAALDPVLLEHRDMMYARHLELPLSL